MLARDGETILACATVTSFVGPVHSKRCKKHHKVLFIYLFRCLAPDTRFEAVIALGPPVITAAQLRAARALLGIDQRKLAELSGLSLPTIQRMEASAEVIRGNVDSLMKLVGALDAAGIALIGEGSASTHGGRGVRLKG